MGTVVAYFYMTIFFIISMIYITKYYSLKKWHSEMVDDFEELCNVVEEQDEILQQYKAISERKGELYEELLNTVSVKNEEE